MGGRTLLERLNVGTRGFYHWKRRRAHTKSNIPMETIDLSMEEELRHRPSSPHDTKDTAIVIDTDDGEDASSTRVSMSPLSSSLQSSHDSQTSHHAGGIDSMGSALVQAGAGAAGQPGRVSTSPTTMVAAASAFPMGGVVVLHDLVGDMEHLNGKTGIVASLPNSSCQHRVMIAGEFFLVMPANLHQSSPTSYGARRAEEKRRKKEERRKQQRMTVKSETKMMEEEVSKGAGDGADVEEEAGEITYAKYRPSKFGYGKDHPDPVVENSTLGAVMPPDVAFDLAMPASIIYDRKLSNLQLEAIAYGCRRHDIDLPSAPAEKRDWTMPSMTVEDAKDVKVDADGATVNPPFPATEGQKRDPLSLRAGFLLGDGAGMGKGRTLAGFVVENIARGRKKHVWIPVSSDLYEDAKRDLSDLGLDAYADEHCFNLSKLPYGDLSETHAEGVMFATYQTLISKNQVKQTRLDQLIEWCGGEDFDGLIMFDECHKAKTIELDADGNPKTKGKGIRKHETSSRTATKVVELQQALPRARIVYCSATSVSHPRNLGFMSRLGLWGKLIERIRFEYFVKSHKLNICFHIITQDMARNIRPVSINSSKV